MGEFDPRQLQEILDQAEKKAQDLQEKMTEVVVEASSGDGTVSVKMNGRRQVLHIRIDPEAVKSGDIEMLQDLLALAVNAAVQKIDQALQSTFGAMLGGMRLPGV